MHEIEDLVASWGLYEQSKNCKLSWYYWFKVLILGYEA